MEELLDLFLGVGAPWPPEGRQLRVENHEAPAFVEDMASRPYTIEPAARPRLEAHRERNLPYRSDARYDLDMFCVGARMYCSASQFKILDLLLLF